MLVAAIFSPYDELFNINWFFKMKTYMPLNGLRWSRNSGSANCDMPQSAVFGRPGGGGKQNIRFSPELSTFAAVLQESIQVCLMNIQEKIDKDW